MPFTTLSTVKKHLLNSTFGPLHVEDLPITLNGTTDTELPHHNIAASSETVKRSEEIAPKQNSPITLSGTTWANLDDPNLVRNSVVAALSEILSTVYVEETDFQIDYDGGRIRRTADSGIPDFTTIQVFYSYYKDLSAGDDYVLDAVNGQIHRTGGGSIPDGATVLIDYAVTAGSVTDELIEQSITEAEDLIIRNLASGYSPSSTDQGLKTGSTWLSLSIIARAYCTEFLGRRTGADGATRGKDWMLLAQQYEAKAWQTLQPFLNPIALRSGLRFSNEPTA
jgi:hypothetical protein